MVSLLDPLCKMILQTASNGHQALHQCCELMHLIRHQALRQCRELMHLIRHQALHRYCELTAAVKKHLSVTVKLPERITTDRAGQIIIELLPLSLHADLATLYTEDISCTSIHVIRWAKV